MRQNIVHPGADELSYEIREIVEVASRLEADGMRVYWENIGDPVAKGEKIQDWMKEKLIEVIREDDSIFGYSPTKGVASAREYIAYERNKEGGIQITPDDILFFNGLGDAISKVYEYLHPAVRVLGPNPAYPTHSSAEAAHAGSPHLTYELDPYNSWYPDTEDIRKKVRENPSINGILIVNPDNPTGMIYPQEIVSDIVSIAREYGLFIISDEIYSNIYYGGKEHKKLASVIGDVPGLAMRGVSKEFPWPGARCGWVEFYNRSNDPVFDRYARSLIDAKMLEVCSTTMPQKMIPVIMSDERYFPYLKEKNARYEARAQEVYDALSELDGLVVHKANGAFYMTVMFEDGVLTDRTSIPIENETARSVVEPYIEKSDALDKRFVYELLAATGICVVPLSSGFNSNRYGFRITLLERDDETFAHVITTLKEVIQEHVVARAAA